MKGARVAGSRCLIKCLIVRNDDCITDAKQALNMVLYVFHWRRTMYDGTGLNEKSN